MSASMTPSEASKKTRQRKAAVTVVGVLLLLQAIFLLALFPTNVVIDFLIRPEAHIVMFFPDDAGFILPKVEIESLPALDILFHFPLATVAIPGKIVASAFFSALAAPVLLTGILFLGTWRPAWTLALFFQCMLLAMALVAYFNYRHPYVYLVMAYSIFMVFYLNHYEIQVAFRAIKTQPTKDRDEHRPGSTAEI